MIFGSMIIKTASLLLRPFRLMDAAGVAALAGDPRVARMLVDIPLPFDEPAARRWLRWSWPELRLGIEQDGRLIGGVCYFCNLGGDTSLGYWLGAAHWGKGYATEAAGALLAHGFERERMQIFRSAHFVDNPASGRVLRRLGFSRVGETGAWCPARQAMVEVVTYALTREAAGYVPVRRTLAGWLGLRPLANWPMQRPVRVASFSKPSA